MFERLNSPEELFHYKLGAALKMENTVLEMLGNLEEAAQRDKLKQQFRHHADETREQIGNIEKAFAALGEEPDDSPCPAIEGIDKTRKAVPLCILDALAQCAEHVLGHLYQSFC